MLRCNNRIVKSLQRNHRTAVVGIRRKRIVLTLHDVPSRTPARRGKRLQPRLAFQIDPLRVRTDGDEHNVVGNSGNRGERVRAQHRPRCALHHRQVRVSHTIRTTEIGIGAINPLVFVLDR